MKWSFVLWSFPRTFLIRSLKTETYLCANCGTWGRLLVLSFPLSFALLLYSFLLCTRVRVAFLFHFSKFTSKFHREIPAFHRQNLSLHRRNGLFGLCHFVDQITCCTFVLSEGERPLKTKKGAFSFRNVLTMYVIHDQEHYGIMEAPRKQMSFFGL